MKKITILAILVLGGIINVTLEAQNIINTKAQQRIAVLCNHLNQNNINISKKGVAAQIESSMDARVLDVILNAKFSKQHDAFQHMNDICNKYEQYLQKNPAFAEEIALHISKNFSSFIDKVKKIKDFVDKLVSKQAFQKIIALCLKANKNVINIIAPLVTEETVKHFHLELLIKANPSLLKSFTALVNEQTIISMDFGSLIEEDNSLTIPFARFINEKNMPKFHSSRIEFLITSNKLTLPILAEAVTEKNIAEIAPDTLEIFKKTAPTEFTQKFTQLINTSNIAQCMDRKFRDESIVEAILKYAPSQAIFLAQHIDENVIADGISKLKETSLNEDYKYLVKNFLAPLIDADKSCIDILQKHVQIPLTEHQEVTKFIQKFALPSELNVLIEKNSQLKNDIIKKQYGIIKELPGVFLKGYDIARIINAERLRACIEQHNLDCLNVPRKYIRKINGQWQVFAELKYEGNLLQLSLKEVQQLAKLTEETGYRDWGANLVRDTSGKLTFIDTEDFSFAIGLIRTEKLLTNCKAQYVLSLFCYKAIMTPEALDWLKERYNYLCTHPEGTTQEPSITNSTKFDDQNIDFETVKREWN